MLLVESFFKNFSNKELCDATKSTEVLVCLSCESRAKIDELVANALAASGTAPNPPKDHGFMYEHGFEDLDGHIWELIYMEPSTQGQGSPGRPWSFRDRSHPVAPISEQSLGSCHRRVHVG